MANIPVERKGGMPGWLWLVLALLLIVILFLLFGRGCETDRGTLVPTDTSTVQTAPTTDMNRGMDASDGLGFTGTADIGTVGALFSRANEGSIVGQTVRLNGVTATDVVGDSTFYVRDEGGAQRVLVVLEGFGESETGGGCSDGRVCVREGDTLDITGRVAALDNTLRSRWPVRADAAQDYYIRARRLGD